MKRTLKALSLVKNFGQRVVVKGVSLKITTGQIVGLLGPNGAGKTTTFYMIAGFIPPKEGKIYLEDRDLSKEPMYKRAQKGIIYLPQEPSVFKRLTVAENILIVLEELKISSKKRQEKLDKLLEIFGVQSLKNKKAYTLSGGERRRVEIMRAMAREPIFLLLDEPFAGIDPLAIADLKNIILDLKKRGLGILISDHNVRETLKVCDYAYIVAEGKMVAQGRPEEISQNEVARKLYLGKDFTL